VPASRTRFHVDQTIPPAFGSRQTSLKIGDYVLLVLVCLSLAALIVVPACWWVGATGLLVALDLLAVLGLVVLLWRSVVGSYDG
jgi:hypothetical protein